MLPQIGMSGVCPLYAGWYTAGTLLMPRLRALGTHATQPLSLATD